MPRKENGFGKTKSFDFKDFKDFGRVDKGKGKGAAGLYPSNRRYGSSVHRSVIEKWNLDSDWVKWRKGYEYYNKSAWYRLETLNPDTLDYEVSIVNSTLYRGSILELDVQFDGYKFATNNSDSNNHYVVKRTILGVPADHETPRPPGRAAKDAGYVPLDLGTVVQGSVRNNYYYDFDFTNKEYLDLKAKREIWLDIDRTDASIILTQMIGERVTDGVTEASLTFVLNDKHEPAIYIGKSLPRDPVEKGVIIDDIGRSTDVEVFSELTTLDITINKDDLNIESTGQEMLDETGESVAQMLTNKLIYIPSLFRGKPLFPPSPDTNLTFIDGVEYFVVDIEDKINVGQINILDPESTVLPTSLLDIADLDKLATADSGEGELNGNFVYDKSLYQRFFGRKYLTADLVEPEVTFISYGLLPFKVLGATFDGTNYILSSEPIINELKLYTGLPNTLVFTDYSFTKTVIDGYPADPNNMDNDKYYYPNEENPQQLMEYYHTYPDFKYEYLKDDNGNYTGEKKIVGELPLWKRVDTDVNPWEDEVFTLNSHLTSAVTYSCSCPNHSQSILAMPQETQDKGTRKINRQKRYPLPSTLSQSDFLALGKNKAAGKIESWESREHRMSFKMCKHSIAVMFIERLKIKEPNNYPTIESREKFEEKLKKEIEEIGSKFQSSYERGGITTLEIILAISQGLNLDDVELANVILNNTF